MRERPILFNAPMVRALLDSRKTQTRRVVTESYFRGNRSVKMQNEHNFYDVRDGCVFLDAFKKGIPCRLGKPGDRLWVRETFAPWRRTSVECPLEWEGLATREDRSGLTLNQWVEERGHHDVLVAYRADGNDTEAWMPSLHMPRWASRISLEITEVRVERLQNISEEDAAAEGIDTSVTNPSPRGVAPIYPKQYGSNVDVFRDLWRMINGPDSWDANPWVWALTFRVLTAAGRAA